MEETNERPLHWEEYTCDAETCEPTGYVEIYKEADEVTDEEIELLKNLLEGKDYEMTEDPANGLIAFDITSFTNDYQIAEQIVDELNNYAEENDLEPLWYVGDSTEEYVHVEIW